MAIHLFLFNINYTFVFSQDLDTFKYEMGFEYWRMFYAYANNTITECFHCPSNRTLKPIAGN